MKGKEKLNRYKKLLFNSGIFAIANMSSSLISFLLVRFYTEMLTAEQYGTIDLITTTASLLLPFFTLSIVEAVLRFSIDSDKPDEVLSTGLIVVFTGILTFSIVGFPVLRVFHGDSFFFWILLLMTVQSIGTIFASFTRGIGRVTDFAIYGILKTVTLVGCNLFFLLILKMKIEGYLCSIIISEIVAGGFLFVKEKLWHYVVFWPSSGMRSEMVRYSLPLVPSSISWWLMNATDKYMLTLFIGVQANGLYAVAHKIPTLITMLSEFFFKAWQLSAVEEFQSEDRDKFYTSVFNALSSVLFVGASVVLLLLKTIIQLLVDSSYANVWRYSSYLVVAMVFSAFSNFLGTNYTATKETKGALVTTGCGALINIILNYFFIINFGIVGAAIATMISFLVTAVMRGYDTRRLIKIDYKVLQLAISTAILIAQASILSFSTNYFVWESILLLILIAVNFRNLSAILKKLLMRVSGRR